MAGSIDIIFVLDASGSMSGLISDTVGGVNHFLREQEKEKGDAYVTLVTFDVDYRQRFRAKKLDAHFAPLTAHDYYDGHGGGTALLDAIGKSINDYALLPIKADKTVFVITTDGLENASREFDRAKVKSLIEKHQGEGWAFVFLGANESAWQGADLGSRAVGAYVADSAGTSAMYDNLSRNIGAVRNSPMPAAASAAEMNFTTGDER